MGEFVVSVAGLERNARELQGVARCTGARMLVALKAFASAAGLRLLRRWADGACASGLYEARQAAAHLGGHIAVYSPAYTPGDITELLEIADHLDFNSLPQWMRFRRQCTAHPRARNRTLRFGLRVNPGYSTGHTPAYDPCVPGSRLGVDPRLLSDGLPPGITGLHLHTLCEQGAQELVDTFRVFERRCRHLLTSPELAYINLGGGHWITRPGYEKEKLISLLDEIREHYSVQIYLEPGEAWCLRTGVLRTRVLDVFESLGYQHALLDVSVSAHMPDVLEMPYRPEVYLARPGERTETTGPTPAVCYAGESYCAAAAAGVLPHTYRLGSPTCLAGDVLGDYSFLQPLEVGDIIVLDDMTHYTMVKTTHFNGVVHPSIMLQGKDGELTCLRRFGFGDYADRLG